MTNQTQSNSLLTLARLNHSFKATRRSLSSKNFGASANYNANYVAKVIALAFIVTTDTFNCFNIMALSIRHRELYLSNFVDTAYEIAPVSHWTSNPGLP